MFWLNDFLYIYLQLTENSCNSISEIAILSFNKPKLNSATHRFMHAVSMHKVIIMANPHPYTTKIICVCRFWT